MVVQAVGHEVGFAAAESARTDELHGCQLQVLVGTVQIHQGLTEKLLVAAKVAFYLKREERACDHIEGLCGTSLQGHGFPEVPPSTELHFQCLGPGREEGGHQRLPWRI